MTGDPTQTPEHARLEEARTGGAMPDTWEYPWFAAWDLAFHCAPLALVGVDFAKAQVEPLLRTRYLHPNGQIPAYEWNFSDVNPPVTPLMPPPSASRARASSPGVRVAESRLSVVARGHDSPHQDDAPAAERCDARCQAPESRFGIEDGGA